MIAIFLYIAISMLACMEKETKESQKHIRTRSETDNPKTRRMPQLRPEEKKPPATEYKTADPGIDLSTLLQKEKSLSAVSIATDWPYTDWKYAKIFTFNFDSMVSRTPWIDHRQDLRQEISMSKSQADIALGLVHRMNGGGIFTKCPFDPHHAVVFYNQKEEQIAYINICFSCRDTILWPAYIPVESNEKPVPETEEAHEQAEKIFDEIEGYRIEVLQKWELFFSRLGADTFVKRR